MHDGAGTEPLCEEEKRRLEKYRSRMNEENSGCTTRNRRIL